MGVFDENLLRQPVMHWQQHQHERYIGPAYDPSRDLSPNLPICDATAASVASSPHSTVGAGHSLHTPMPNNNNNINSLPNKECKESVLQTTHAQHSHQSVIIGGGSSLSTTHVIVNNRRSTLCSNGSGGNSSASSTSSTSNTSTNSNTSVVVPSSNNNNNNINNINNSVFSSSNSGDSNAKNNNTNIINNNLMCHYPPVPKIEPPCTPEPAMVRNMDSVGSDNNNTDNCTDTEVSNTRWCEPPSMVVAVCAGCNQRISDRFYLEAVDRRWHAACLRCCQCRQTLDGEVTCFSRDGNIYCKKDYYRLFGMKQCARCHETIRKSELVMRARDLVFHLNCFTCAVCSSALTKGDHFGMRDTTVLCRLHFEATAETPLPIPPISGQQIDSPGPVLPPHLQHPYHSGLGMLPSAGTPPGAMGNFHSSMHQSSHHVSPSPFPPPSHSGSGGNYSSPFPSPTDFHSSHHHHHHFHSHHSNISPPHHHAVHHHSGGMSPRPQSTGACAISATLPASQTPNSIVDCSNSNKVPSFFNGSGASTPTGAGVATTPRQKGRPRKRKPKDLESMTANLDLNSDYLDMPPFGRSPGTPGMHGSSNQRTKRMRTSFKHHQLRTMKSYFAVNHNPDAKDLKQLSQKTGLPKRVLQVWFQNARAKWRRMVTKQEGKSSSSTGGDKMSGSESGGGIGDFDLYDPPCGPDSLTGSIQSLPPQSPPFMLDGGPGSPNSLNCGA